MPTVNQLLRKKRIRPKKSEVDRLLASNLLAKELINWTPKFSNKKGLINGLKKTIRWFSSPKNIKFYNTDYNI